MFVLGCQDLIVITDHKPLLSIFNNRDLGTIMNPQILKSKEKTFSTVSQYNTALANGIRLQMLFHGIHQKPLNHQYPLSKNYVPHHPQNHYTKQKKLRWPLTPPVLFHLQPLIALLQKPLPVTNLAENLENLFRKNLQLKDVC